ncbi:MAG: adenylate kinase [Bacteroidota bacterium]|jgi:adenylate kinase|nr:adenylate kinase [Bacteroidota bacterium]
MLNIVIFGGPGSGKGTQSALIAEKYNLIHLSTGDLLRDEAASGSELGKLIHSFIDKGNLVPDQLMLDILSRTIDNLNGKKGVIFDGFPRTIAQAEALDEILEKRNEKLNLLLHLKVADEILQERMLFRSKTSGRSDDTLETIKKRIDIYHQVTAPVIDYYRHRGLYHAIMGNGSGTVETIFAEVSSYISAYQQKR